MEGNVGGERGSDITSDIIEPITDKGKPGYTNLASSVS